jgi:hypothetical protein
MDGWMDGWRMPYEERKGDLVVLTESIYLEWWERERGADQHRSRA